MKKIQITLLGFLLPILCFSQVNEIKFNTQSIDFSLPPRTNISPMSIKLMDNYNKVGAPTTYGSILEIYGLAGHQTSQLYFGGWDNSKIRYREAFYNQNTWSSWITLLDSKNIVESDGVLKIKGTGNSTIAGNLGIGTATPRAKLQIASGTDASLASSSGFLVAGQITTKNLVIDNDEIMARENGSTSSLYLQSDGGDLFVHNNLGIANQFSVLNSGEVGIGTSTPTEKLQVNGNVLATSFKKSGGTSSQFLMADGSTTTITNANTIYTTDGILSGPRKITMGANPITFSGTGNYIINAGNVGIGTMTPSAKLDVNGAIFLKGKPVINSDGTSSYFQSNAASYFENMGSVSATITASGNFGIGTTTPDEKLAVNGNIHAREVRVDLTGWPDYVFQKYYTGKSELKSDYELPTLAEVENFTKKNNHLPSVPSAREIKEKGLQLGEMSNVLLQKVEELTIYIIEQQKEIQSLKKENEQYKLLVERVTALEKK